VNQFFRGGLPVAPGDGNDRSLELVAVPSSKGAERLGRIGDRNGARIRRRAVLREPRLFDEQTSRSPMESVVDESVSIVVFAAYCHEELA
jgi:hypothetical protein